MGPLKGQVAAVGTTAAIRRAGAYPDGRLDILTVGQQRFRLEGVDNVSEPYLVGQVSLLDEPTGPEGEANDRAERVGRRFIEYLELLQPVANARDGHLVEAAGGLLAVTADEGHRRPVVQQLGQLAAAHVMHALCNAGLRRKPGPPVER